MKGNQILRLIHHSANPLIRILSVAQTNAEERSCKPLGLWVSCADFENNWKDWCKSENFRTDDFVYENQIILSPKANILTLNGPFGLDAFTSQYGEKTYRLGYLEKIIDWKRVADDYQGIIIAPYVWERRMTLNWYYGWDCASGCIWDSEAVDFVKSVKAIRKTPQPPSMQAESA
jgi:hypothetical protein